MRQQWQREGSPGTALWDVLGSPQGGKIRETVRWETQCQGGACFAGSDTQDGQGAGGRGGTGRSELSATNALRLSRDLPPPRRALLEAEGSLGQDQSRAGRTVGGQDAHHVEAASVWEDPRQDLGLQLLDHWPPRVSADGHQHIAGRVLVRLFQLLRGWGRKP